MERLVQIEMNSVDDQAKSQIRLLIDFQLAYMNTNHEDFGGVLGFVGNPLKMSFREKKVPGETPEMSQKKQMRNVRIGCGWLTTHNLTLLGSKDFYFVLTAESLSWYRDETVCCLPQERMKRIQLKEKRYMLSLDGLKLRSIESGFMSRQHKFVLFNVEGR